jgi:hypothetical protein
VQLTARDRAKAVGGGIQAVAITDSGNFESVWSYTASDSTNEANWTKATVKIADVHQYRRSARAGVEDGDGETVVLRLCADLVGGCGPRSDI